MYFSPFAIQNQVPTSKSSMMFKEAERRKEARVEKNSKRSHLESEVEGEVEQPVVLSRCVVVRVEIQLQK